MPGFDFGWIHNGFWSTGSHGVAHAPGNPHCGKMNAHPSQIAPGLFLVVNLVVASSLANLGKVLFHTLFCHETVSTLLLDTRLFKQTKTVDLICCN